MFLMYSKLGFTVLFFFIDTVYAIMYTILCLVLWIAMRQPKYTGKSKIIRSPSPPFFYEQIMGYEEDDMVVGLKAHEYFKKQAKLSKKEKKSADKTKNFSKITTTLLIFTANWCESCVFTYTIWIKFANRFSTEKLRVVEIDTQRNEKVARFFSVNHRDGKQLPTLILMEDNKEFLRFPPIDYEKATMSKVITYKEKELIKYFDLDRRFLATNVESSVEQSVTKKRANV